MLPVVYLETYGCSANLNDAEIIKGLLVSHGLTMADNEDLADIVILNTCVVKDPTIKKIEIRIKHFLQNRKKAQKLVITGCMPEVQEKRLAKLAPSAALVSTHHIKEIPKVIKSLLEGKRTILTGKTSQEKVCLPKLREKKCIGITQISQGCLGECAYCYTRQAKHSLFSFQESQILKNIEQDLLSGCKEIWLTSQDNALYGLDFDDINNNLLTDINKDLSTPQKDKEIINNINSRSSLPQLINRITSLNHRFYLRIGMMNPERILPILDALIQSYKNEKVYKFLHIPIQSGSDKILKSMNRKYKVKDFITIISRFKKEFPDLVIATDIIVGFPGETDDDFNKTLALISNIKPDVLNISRFWAMPNTEAAELKQISPKIKRERAVKMMNLHAKIALENKKLLVGREYKALISEKGFQNTWIARNENYQMIIIRSKDNLLGKFLKIKVKETKPHYMIGEIIS